MSRPEALHLPATYELLDGWIGPVVVDHPWINEADPVAVLGVHHPSAGGQGITSCCDWALLVDEYADTYRVPVADLSLDLARAQCRDRVARVLRARGLDLEAVMDPDVYDEFERVGLAIDWTALRPGHLLAIAREHLLGALKPREEP